MRRSLLAVVVLGAAFESAAQRPDSNPPCDRACLEGFVDRYLEAMLENDPSPELFAIGARFTENGIQLPLGNEGLWYGMSGYGRYKFYVPDVETQQVAFIGTVRENLANAGMNDGQGDLVAIALRLKIVNDKITEVEQLVIRPEVDLFGGGTASNRPFPPTGEAVDAMGAPHPIFLEEIPESERMSRDELIVTANYYFDGLQRNDGKGYYPFTDDCERYENGIKTTNVPRTDQETGETRVMGCKEQFEKALRGVVSRIRDRRFVAVDRERGNVFAFGFFDHDRLNWTWQLAEIFKIEKGQIRRIEAVFHRAPYGINSGWSTFEQGMSEAIQVVR